MTTRTVTVAGSNLFRVAAEQYGDASLWIVLAEANAMPDPQLAGVNTLLVPDRNPARAGGAPLA